ncbi:MAG: glycosyltransferase family 4 protein [Candidatus Omnitrophica bacterium]|nr:glycosyltransferase family 4 protein [Candidatus Omnitrophota bacterium]
MGIYVYEMSRALVRAGHNVYIITKTEDVPVDYIDEGVRVFRVRPKRIKIWDTLRLEIGGLLERLEYSLAVSEKIRQILKFYPIDIVESIEARAEGFWYYLFKNTPPLVIKLHTPEGIIFKWNKTPHSLDVKLMTKLEEFWLMRAKKLIGVTFAINELMKHLYGVDSIPVIYNPLDVNRFNKSNNSSVSEAKRDINILYVGRLEFRKGVHILVRAIPKVLERIPHAKFSFIGDDCGMRWYLEKKIDEFRIQKYVNFISHISREKLIDFYLRATVCVIPSLWENFPYSCLEPMALGRAVIAADVGGIKEIIEDGINGILFKAGSNLDLADRIISLCLDDGLREKIESNSKKRIEFLCNPEKIVLETIKLYENCLK